LAGRENLKVPVVLHIDIKREKGKDYIEPFSPPTDAYRKITDLIFKVIKDNFTGFPFNTLLHW